MSLRNYRRKRVTPEWQEIARKAAAWAASPEGQTAINQVVVDAKEAVKPLKEAQRRGAERLLDEEFIIYGQP